MLDCRPMDTPMDSNVKLLSGQGELLKDPGRYLLRREKYRVGTEFYLFQRKRKIAIKPQMKNDLATKSGFRSRLCKEKVLAPPHPWYSMGTTLYQCVWMLFIYMLLAIENEMKE